VIHLWTNVYDEPDEARRAELDEAARRRGAVWDVRAMTYDGGARPEFADIFRAASEAANPWEVSAILCADCYVDETIALAEQIRPDEVFCLSPYNDPNGTRLLYDNPKSQDGWIWRGKIVDLPAGMRIGQGAGEQRLAWELRARGRRLSNPSLSIHVWHLHSGTGPRAWESLPHAQGPKLGVPLSTLYERDRTICFAF
jgi:hypothetical protein